MGRIKDRFWDYAEDLNGRFKCIFCKRDYPGSASRIKSHLAGVKGHNISICDAVPDEVQKEAYQAIQGTNKKRASIASSASRLKTKMRKIVTQDMAEIVLNDVVDRIRANAFSLIATEDIGFELSFKVELENLLETLFKIKFVLDDAQKRQSSDDSMRTWLKLLRKEAYHADNVLDKFSYEILRRKVQIQNQTMDKVCSSSLHNLKISKLSLDRIVHDVAGLGLRMDRIVHDVAGLGLRMELEDSTPKIILDMNIDPLLDDLEVVGREYDVTKIVNILISSSNQQVISVLPIVGMAGLGKTTLAKLVYNNELIKKHFDVLAWVNVGKHFDVEGILREILESLEEDLSVSMNDKIHQICAEKLRAIKYLLILDDVQDEDLEKWDSLKWYLSKYNSRLGNNIVVTTRSDNVAEIMKTHPIHQLEKLSEDDCWSIFKKRSFAEESSLLTLDLEVIGRKIAKRCGGVPLAARILGGIMCFNFNKNKWLEFQNNQIWDLLDEDNSDIFPVLKLCFDHLPTPFLKRCFAYCAVFPKYYDMRKDEVIQYWMAEGLLRANNMVMEDIGDMYFNILLATSFFQNPRKDACGDIISCKMHNLVHDFALSISKYDILILEGDSVDNVSKREPLFVRSDGKTIPRTLFDGGSLIKVRTLISKNLDFDGMLSSFEYLRVLKLSGHGITGLPNSIEQLMHLRLLHISHTEIEELPKSITKLYNLQTLRIEKCPNPMELPEDLSNLINLRHICIIDCKNAAAPKNIGRLTCLQTLSKFCVRQDEGYRMKELGPLKNLRGEIYIHGLEKVEDEEEAKSAKLKEKEIFKLVLVWSSGTEFDSGNKHEKVLEGLHPHPKLKSLTIIWYRGKKFPPWVNDLSLFQNLIQIKLSWCIQCEEVPTLGHLRYLRVLEIIRMDKVRSIGSEFYSYSHGSNTDTILFPALRMLKLERMLGLEEWKDAKELTSAKVFPCLEELIIRMCCELRHLPGVPLPIRHLEIIDCGIEELSSGLQFCTSLRYLKISGCLNLKSIPDSLHTCDSLQKLVVERCPDLSSLPGVPSVIRHLEIIGCGIDELSSGLQFGASLRYLKINRCSNLKSIPESLHSCVSLQKFAVRDCCKLSSLPGVPSVIRHLEIIRCGIDELPSGLQLCTSLQYLKISGCLNLKSIPESLDTCVSLQKLVVERCPDLSSLPCVPPLIQHLEIIECGIDELSSGLQCCASLRYLKISGCSNLKSIPESLHSCVSLQKFVVRDCRKLSSLPGVLSVIRHLEIIRCGIDELPGGLQFCASLQYLEIEDCPIRKPIPDLGEVFHSLINLKLSNCPDLRLKLRREGRLKTLVIGGFIEELDAFPILRYPSIRHSHASLKKLILHGSPTLNSLPNEIQLFTALEELQIQNFNGMEALPDWFSYLSSLQKLSLYNCKRLKYLPILHLTNLKHLYVRGCHNLEERFAEGSSAEWGEIDIIKGGEASEDSEDFHIFDGEKYDSFDDSEDD